jgi:hypothetical protein
VDEMSARTDPQTVLQFLTTEHFTLQTARGSASAEISSRLQLYLGTLSSTIVAIALVAQLSDVGSVFVVFTLVLLPVVYYLGVVTNERLLQIEAEWRVYGQGMSRIRHYYLEVAPEMAPYFVLPATDDPWAGLQAVAIRGQSWRHGLITAPAVVVVINSVLAGVFAAVLANVAVSGLLLPGLCAAAGFALSLVVQAVHLNRVFQRDLRIIEVAFPATQG